MLIPYGTPVSGWLRWPWRKLAADADHFLATMGIFRINGRTNPVPSNRPAITLLRRGLSAD
jgi:hypothetical protein